MSLVFSPLTLGGYEGFDSDDFLTALPERCADDPLPIVVYLENERVGDAELHERIEQDLTFNEKLGIGGQMFHVFRMDGARIDDSHPFHEILGGKTLPRAVVLSPQGEKVGALEGKSLTPRKLVPLMDKASEPVFIRSMGKFVKDYEKILDALDKLAVEREKLFEKRGKERKLTAAKEKSYEKREEVIWEKEQKLYDQEAELLEFERRSNKKIGAR